MPPTSSVAALPNNSPATFMLSWSGSDSGGSGVATYSIYVSNNGGAFLPLLTNTTLTSTSFTGQTGHTYGFYSIATDNVGNVQATPTAAQATTTVSASGLTALLSGPTGGVVFQTLAFSIGASDPSPADQAGNFIYLVSWGDGTTDRVTGRSSIDDTHAYSVAGTYTVTLTATDQDGNVSPAVSQQVSVLSTPEIQNGTLAIPGTTTAASITLTPTLPNGASAYSMKVTYTINGITTNFGPYAASTIEVYGGGGTDAVILKGTTGSDSFTVGNGTVGEVVAMTTTFIVGLNAVTTTTLDGDGGSDNLTGPNQTNAWVIASRNAGTLNATIAFESIENLTGSSFPNTFSFINGGSITGSLIGEGTTNTLDDSQYGNPVTIHLQTTKATGIGGTWTNIQSFVGTGTTDSLVSANTINTWSITGTDTGTVDAVSFSGFPNLTGGNTDDTFAFLPGGSIAGNISGGAPVNTLDFSGYGSPVTVNLQAKSATGNVGTIVGTWSNIQSFVGTDTSDTLIGPNGTNTWSITGSNAGTVGGDSFAGFPNLTGGTGNNNFKFVSPGMLTGSINGGGGTDTITGDANGDNFTISGSNSGSVAVILPNGFSDIQNLTGGTGNDMFAFLPGGSITGNLSGGAGSNAINDSGNGSPVTVNLQAQTATGIGGTWADVQSFIGTGTTDTLVGANSNSNWSISGTNAGSVGAYSFAGFPYLTGGTGNDAFTFVSPGELSGAINGGGGNDTIIGDNNGDRFTISGSNSGYIATILPNGFSEIQNLTGSTASDTFAFLPGGSLAGNLRGGPPVNTLDYSGYGSAVTVNLQTKTATGIGGIWANIQTFIGTGTTDTLMGANSTSTWSITGTNMGTVGTYSFAGFPNLTGGTGNNTFAFSSAASVSGSITGGGGTNTLDYTGFGSPVTVNLQTTTATAIGGIWSNIQSFKGTDTTDTFIATDGTTNNWALRGNNAGTVDGVSFSGFANLTGGSAADIFQFANGATVSGVINGAGGSNTLNYSAYTGGVTVNLGNATTGLANSSATGVNGGNSNGISNIGNVIVGAGNNYLTAVGVTTSISFTATGNGDNILVGGSGSNALTASGSGDNIIIGGIGISSIVGGTGYNLLIGGSTAYDAVYADLEAILTVWKTITSTTRYAQVITDLTASSYAYSLTSATVQGNPSDTITAGTHKLDWYFAASSNEITGKNSGETVTPC